MIADTMVTSGHFRLLKMIGTPTAPQFQPLSMSWNKVWVDILSEAAVIERPDFSEWKKTRQWRLWKFLTLPKSDQTLGFHGHLYEFSKSLKSICSSGKLPTSLNTKSFLQPFSNLIFKRDCFKRKKRSSKKLYELINKGQTFQDTRFDF